MNSQSSIHRHLLVLTALATLATMSTAQRLTVARSDSAAAAPVVGVIGRHAGLDRLEAAIHRARHLHGISGDLRQVLVGKTMRVPWNGQAVDAAVDLSLELGALPGSSTIEVTVVADTFSSRTTILRFDHGELNIVEHQMLAASLPDPAAPPRLGIYPQFLADAAAGNQSWFAAGSLGLVDAALGFFPGARQRQPRSDTYFVLPAIAAAAAVATAVGQTLACYNDTVSMVKACYRKAGTQKNNGTITQNQYNSIIECCQDEGDTDAFNCGITLGLNGPEKSDYNDCF